MGLHSQLAQASVLFKKPLINPDTDSIPVTAVTAGGLPAAVHTGLSVKNVKIWLSCLANVLSTQATTV